MAKIDRLLGIPGAADRQLVDLRACAIYYRFRAKRKQLERFGEGHDRGLLEDKLPPAQGCGDSGLDCLISGLDCLISGLVGLISGLDGLISGLDCLISGLDCLISGLDCLNLALTVLIWP